MSMEKKREIKVKRKAYYCETRQSWVLPITRGLETLIDEEDVAELGKYNWCWNPFRKTCGYVSRTANSKAAFMHRQIMNAPRGMVVDHINGNSLDNRKSNLRICTHRENSQNTYKHRSGKLVGCYFHKRSKKWEARIEVNGVRKCLGSYATDLEAHEVYKAALEKIAGR